MAKIKIKKSDGSWIDMPIVAVSGGGGTATEVSYNAVTKAMGAAFVFSEEITVDVKLKTILPEETVTSVTNLTNYTHGVDRLSLGIIDPLDNKPKVKINIEGQENNRRPNLF